MLFKKKEDEREKYKEVFVLLFIKFRTICNFWEKIVTVGLPGDKNTYVYREKHVRISEKSRTCFQEKPIEVF